MGEQVAAGELGGISSVGRAPALQAGGHEFDSRILHSAKKPKDGLIAQLVRAHA